MVIQVDSDTLLVAALIMVAPQWILTIVMMLRDLRRNELIDARANQPRPLTTKAGHAWVITSGGDPHREPRVRRSRPQYPPVYADPDAPVPRDDANTTPYEGQRDAPERS